jgi:methionyl-tRNA formyltransferase
VQKKYSIARNDTFNSLVKKNYKIAADAMLEAIDILEKGGADYIDNSDTEASYNTTPSLKEAIRYRLGKKLEY